MDEATELLSALENTAPTTRTACSGWTAHELVAHLTAGAAEMAALTEESVAGLEPRPTQGFRDREAPFVQLPDDELRDRLVIEALRLSSAVASLRTAGPAGSVSFSGRRLTAAELDLHGRSEAALHRWDLAGDDPISIELLSQPELTAHATSVLSSMLDGSPESVASRVDASRVQASRLTFAAPGEPDVVFVHDPAGPRWEMAAPTSEPTAISDPATRLLALWGRATTTGTIAWTGEAPECRDLSRLLGGLT
jgi:uncharacterized protein (TIGR03083 family)